MLCVKILTAAVKVDAFPEPTFAPHIICHCVWPVASLKNSSGFPMASKVHLIAYQPINNEEQGLYRREMAEALSPALWKQKQCTLQNILETLESPLFYALSHLHSIKDLEQKGKKLATHTSCIWNLGSSWSALAAAEWEHFLPPMWRRSWYWGPKSLITGIFSAVNTYKKKPPNPTMVSSMDFFFIAGANIVH